MISGIEPDSVINLANKISKQKLNANTIGQVMGSIVLPVLFVFEI